MKLLGKLLVAAMLIPLSACNTYYDPADPYTRGLRFYDRGMTGVAREIWEPMAQQGDCDAQARYALTLFQQSDIQPDQPKGLAVMQDAAKRGHPLAQLTLGSLYHNGRIPSAGAAGITITCSDCGITSNPVEAVKWLTLGRKHAVYDSQRHFADRLLPLVKATMSAQDIATAESMVAQWNPQGSLCKPRSLW